MAIGDLADIAARWRRLLPRGWFSDTAQNVAAVADGMGAALSGVYGTQATAKAVMRLSTCPGVFLDVFAADFFGIDGLPRVPGEGNEAYRARIKWNLTAPRGTRAGMIGMLQYLTGRTPIVVNPGRPSDVGAWNYARGYNTAGAYGSMKMPYQAFVVAYRGVPVTAGAGSGDYATLPVPAGGYYPGGYGVGAIAYGSLNAVGGAMTDAHILQQIAAWTPAHSVAWTQLRD